MNKDRLVEQLLDAYDGDVVAIGRAIKEAKSKRRPVIKADMPDLSDSPIVVSLENVTKTYKLGKNKVMALNDVSLTVRQGDSGRH